MKTLICTLAIAASLLSLGASDAEGLFVAGAGRAWPKPELKDGDFIIRFKAVRLQLTRAVFRFDTEDKTRFWLEVDIQRRGAPRAPDPGDFYVFRIEGKDYTGFVTRGSINDDGWRWALGMTDVAAGRALLAKIGKAYGLSGSRLQDQTKEGGKDDASRRTKPGG